ncbi:MAG TPA: hypothetical protein VHZ32_00280 [Rhizomicrobium sp.]|jgi:hypothetical protein|nr:hypothetical protein [Rhizomicrobium sp.]
MRPGHLLLAIPLLACSSLRAVAFDLSQDVAVSGYADFRLIAPDNQTSWLNYGLGKFRFGPNRGNARFVEGVLQVDAAVEDDLHFIAVGRAEAEQRSGVDALEAYFSWKPRSDGDLVWSVKTGIFFPTISLENDDIGWTSPYTLTPSAINTWIGEELRTFGSEAIVKWRTDIGTFSAMGALFCCNDPAGVLIADRGWAMDDRPSGIFERLPLPDATMHIFHAPLSQRTAEFEEIDGRVGWYYGLGWQIPDVGKITVVNYNNQADDAAATSRDGGWATRFWSVGARTQLGPVTLIAQGMTGDTGIEAFPGADFYTDFQSAFLLVSYDIDDWRLSLREDVFQTRSEANPSSPMNEDGHALTMAASWTQYEWLRVTGEWIVMSSRKGEYVLDGMPSPNFTGNQFQLSTRFSF